MSTLDDPRTQEEREQQGTGGPESLGVGLEGPGGAPMTPGQNGNAEPDALPFVCPECQAEGVERRFAKQQGLTRHRGSAHGILSTNRDAQNKRKRAKAKAAGTTNRKPGKPRVVKTLDTTKLIAMVQAKHPKMDADRLARLNAWVEEAQELFDGR